MIMSQTAKNLQQVVTDSTALLMHIQSTHWNTTGPLFYPIHKQTEEQYEELFAAIDDIAERMRAINVLVENAPVQVAQNTTVKHADMNADEVGMLKNLIEAHQSVRDTLQKCMDVADDEDDDVTEDLIISRAAVHDKAIWLLKSMLPKAL